MNHRPGPVNYRIQPWIADDGTPFLAYAASNMLPDGVKIVGNGTITHPLDVQLSGPYSAARDLLKACQAVSDALSEKANSVVSYLPPQVVTQVRASIAKAERR